MNENEIAEQCYEVIWSGDITAQDLGMTVTVDKAGSAEASFEICPNMVNGHGLCHGGYIFTLADTAFAFAGNTYNLLTVAASASIEFIAPASVGDRLTAKAEEVSRGGRTGIYDVTVTNQDGKVIAIFRGRSYATRKPIL